MWLYQGDNCWRSSSKTEPFTCALDIDFVLLTYWLLTTTNNICYSPHVVNHLKFIHLKEIASYNYNLVEVTHVRLVYLQVQGCWLEYAHLCV